MLVLLGFTAGCAFGLFFGWLLHRERVERALYEDVVRTRDRATATLAETSARLELANKDMVRLRGQLTNAQHLLAERDATISELEDELAELEEDDELEEPAADEPVDVAADAATTPDDVRLFDDLDDEADITEEVPLPPDDELAEVDAGDTDRAPEPPAAAHEDVEGEAPAGAAREAHGPAAAAGPDQLPMDQPVVPEEEPVPVDAPPAPEEVAGRAPEPVGEADRAPERDGAAASVEEEEPEPPEPPPPDDVVIGDAPVTDIPLDATAAGAAEDATDDDGDGEHPAAEDAAAALGEQPPDDAEIGVPLVLEADAPEPGPEADDLQRISGVGPALERQLHAEGITTYRQLAVLDDAAVSELESRRPRLVTRLRRGGWVAQARRLHVETYGTQP